MARPESPVTVPENSAVAPQDDLSEHQAVTAGLTTEQDGQVTQAQSVTTNATSREGQVLDSAGQDTANISLAAH